MFYVLFRPDLILNQAILSNNEKAVLPALSSVTFHMCCTKNTNQRGRNGVHNQPQLCAYVQLQAIIVVLLRIFAGSGRWRGRILNYPGTNLYCTLTNFLLKVSKMFINEI